MARSGSGGASRRAQRGVALLALLAVAVMVFAYVLTSRLNAASMFVAVDRDHNALVMARAKQALIGWMVINAAGDDASPGRLPCPEAPGDFNTVNEGRASGNCVLPAVGRLPWRQLGLEKLVDAAGEPLWYVVSPNWALASGAPPVKPTINSDTVGQLSLDGDSVVALIIAPGATLSTQACGGAAARAQSRPVAGPPDLRDYLECTNATFPADAAFASSAAGNPFNDQVLAIRTGDLVPALEAAIQQRMQREIAPALKGVYAAAPWRRSTFNVLTSTNPLYPFAAPFSNPQTANFRGAAGTYQGLPPFVYSETAPGSGTACTGDPRCDPLAVQWTGGTLSGASILSPSCTVVTGTTTRLDCSFYYICTILLCNPPTLNYTIQAQATGVGMALRQVNMSAPVGSANVTASIGGASAVFNTAGGINLTLTGTATPTGSGGFLSNLLGNTLCGLPLVEVILGCKQSLISVPIGVLADHPLLDANDATTGWFVRNEWHKYVYYAVADQSTPLALPAHGCDSSNCLRFNDGWYYNIRSLLVLSGSILPGQTRPSASALDYVEFQNGDLGTLYEQRPVRGRGMAPNANAPWNDRVVLVDWNSALQAPVQVIDANIPTVPVNVARLP